MKKPAPSDWIAVAVLAAVFCLFLFGTYGIVVQGKAPSPRYLPGFGLILGISFIGPAFIGLGRGKFQGRSEIGRVGNPLKYWAIICFLFGSGVICMIAGAVDLSRIATAP